MGTTTSFIAKLLEKVAPTYPDDPDSGRLADFPSLSPSTESSTSPGLVIAIINNTAIAIIAITPPTRE
jgi:hypothetical protein